MKLPEMVGRIGLVQGGELHAVRNQDDFVETGATGTDEPKEVLSPQHRWLSTARDDRSLSASDRGEIDPSFDLFPIRQSLLLLGRGGGFGEAEGAHAAWHPLAIGRKERDRGLRSA